MVIEICRIAQTVSCLLPVAGAAVSAGFPSPADDYIEKTLDLNELMIKHPAATFFVRVQGDSMQDANIYPGDILLVDRAVEPKHGNIVLAILNGEFTVKRLSRCHNQITLIPENQAYKPIPIHEEADFQVWGVVTYVIHRAR